MQLVSEKKEKNDLPLVPKSDSEYAPRIIRKYNDDESVEFLVVVNGMIGPPECYVELVHELYNAKSNDVFTIVIQSGGGYVSGGTILSNAISSSLAKVTTVANGNCASAAFTIWTAAKHKEVRKWSRVMAHMSSHGCHGNSVDIVERSTDIVDYIKFLLQHAMDDKVITQEEYDLIVNNKKDVFIPYEIVLKRLGGAS